MANAIVTFIKRLVYALKLGTSLKIDLSPKMAYEDYSPAVSLLPFYGLIEGFVCALLGGLGLLTGSFFLAATLAVVGGVVVGGTSRLRSSSYFFKNATHKRTGSRIFISLFLLFELLVLTFLAGDRYYTLLSALECASVSACLACVALAWRKNGVSLPGGGNCKVRTQDMLVCVLISTALLGAFAGLWGLLHAGLAFAFGCALSFASGGGKVSLTREQHDCCYQLSLLLSLIVSLALNLSLVFLR